MHPLLSQALQEAYASCSVDKEVVNTLEVASSTGTPASVFMCTGLLARSLQLEDGTAVTYQPVPFSFDLPPVDPSGGRSLTVNIENINGDVIRWIKSARDSGSFIYLKHRVYLVATSSSSSASLKPQNPRPLVMVAQAAPITLKGITITATVADVVNRTFPNAFYSFAAYPGLRG